MGMGAAGCAAPPQCRCAQLPAEGRQWPLRRCCQYKRNKRTRCVRFFCMAGKFSARPAAGVPCRYNCRMCNASSATAFCSSGGPSTATDGPKLSSMDTRNPPRGQRAETKKRPSGSGVTSCGQNRSYTRCAAQGRNISSICSIHGGSSSRSSGGGAPCAPGSKPCSSMRAPSIRHNLNVRHSPRARQKACRYHALLL